MRYLKGMWDAGLKRLSRQGRPAPPDPKQSLINALQAWGGHGGFLEAWIQLWQPDEFHQIAQNKQAGPERRGPENQSDPGLIQPGFWVVPGRNHFHQRKL